MKPAPIIRLKYLPENMGAFLIEARKNRGLTRYALAKLAGVAHSQITRIESGKSVTVNHLASVCFALGLPLWVPLIYSVDVEVDASQVTASGGFEVSTARLATLIELASRIAISPTAEPFPDIPDSDPDSGLLKAFALYCSECGFSERLAIIEQLSKNPSVLISSWGFIPAHKENENQRLTNGGAEITPEIMTENHWPNLRERVAAMLTARGARFELARSLGISRQAVSRYLSGKSTPSAEIALALLDWANSRQKKSPNGVRAPLEPKARTKQSKSNEKRSPGQGPT